MSRLLVSLSAVMIFASTAPAAENWSKEHPNAAKALDKILDKNPEFRAALASFTKNHAQRAKHVFTYLTTKEGRTLKSYEESQDKKNEAFRHLMKLKKKYPVRIVRVREWAQNHRKPARHLFQQDDAARYILGKSEKGHDHGHGHDHKKHDHKGKGKKHGHDHKHKGKKKHKHDDDDD